MTRQEFKDRWESDENGGGITFEDIAVVAQEWGLYNRPKIHPMTAVLFAVLQAANCEEGEDSDA